MENRYLSFIYEIENCITGETYVGQHKVVEKYIDNPYDDPYMGNSHYLNGNIKRGIKSEFEKYGKHNFDRKILILGYFTPKQLGDLEKAIIKLRRESGKAEYNISAGGRNCMLGRHHLKESKIKSSISNSLARQNDSSINKRMLKTRKENNNWGCKQETKEKLSILYKGKLYEELHGKEEAQKIKTKISKSLKGKRLGMKAYNNGEINVFAKSQPEGFIPGIIPRKEWKSKRGLKWYTNGIDYKFQKDCPEGYWPGKKPLTQKHKEALIKANTGRICSEEKKKN